MDDLISRQAAIDRINKQREHLQPDIYPQDKIGDAAYRICAEFIERLPSAEPKTDDENELKFYYVESIDDYWIGQRLDNFYYADWHDGLGFVWSKSRYLPWGEHVVNKHTLWKEHTYPSEPKEIPFTMWIVGFMKKYSAEPKIIRCKDCKNSEHWYRDRRICFLWSEDGVSVFDDGFCSYAERRTDE